MKILKLFLLYILVPAAAFAGSGIYFYPPQGGDVNGPVSATDNAIVRFDGTTGKLLQNSIPTINDLGDITTTGKTIFGANGGAGSGTRNFDWGSTITDFSASNTYDHYARTILNPTTDVGDGFGSFVAHEYYVDVQSVHNYNFSNFSAGEFQMLHSGDGDLSLAFGLFGQAYNSGAGDITSEQVGGYFISYNVGSGNISGTNPKEGNYAIAAGTGNFGAGNIAQDYIFYGESPYIFGGSITSHWGLYLEDQEFGTNSWAIQTAGGKIQFGSPVGKNPLVYLEDGDVAHGMTNLVPTDIFGAFLPIAPTTGGLKIQGYSDTDATAMLFEGFVGTATPSGTVKPFIFQGWKKNGTTRQALGDSEILMSVANGSTEAFHVNGNGLVVFDNGTQGSAGFGYDEIVTNTTVTGTIPIDDTIPQNTEGDEILSASITTHSASSKVRIHISLFGALGTAGAWWSTGIFRDAEANAINAFTGNRNMELQSISYSFEDSPGAAGTFTYKVRVGANTGNVYLNGTSSGRFFGGSARCTLILEEVL